MTKFATVIIPYALTPRWAQILISTLKEHKNTKDCEIYIMNNNDPTWSSVPPVGLKAEGYWENRGGLKCITQTSLGEGINVIDTPKLSGKNRVWPGECCDMGIEIADTITKTPYLFTLDSDCSIMRDGWLDWYASFMKDDYVAMAGLWWNQPGRMIISPCATLYNMRILKQLRDETQRNKETTICYGEHNEKRVDHTGRYLFNGVDAWAETIKKGYGPFNEQRGFFRNIRMYSGPFCSDPWNIEYYNKNYFNDKAGHEHGSWLYNRASNQWECVAVPGKFMNLVGHVDEKDVKMDQTGNYYGDSFEECYVFHYWGGTGTHNFKVGYANDPFSIAQVQWFLTREHELWKKFVPEFIRKESLEKGYIEDFDLELNYAMGQMCIDNVYPARAPLLDIPRRK